MAKRNKTKTAPGIVTLVVPLWRNELEEFREYCKTIDSDPREVVESFIRAVNSGQIDVTPAPGAPMVQ